MYFLFKIQTIKIKVMSTKKQLKIYVKTQECHPYYKGITNTTKEFTELMSAQIYYNDMLKIDEGSNGFHFTTIELSQSTVPL